MTANVRGAKDEMLERDSGPSPTGPGNVPTKAEIHCPIVSLCECSREWVPPASSMASRRHCRSSAALAIESRPQYDAAKVLGNRIDTNPGRAGAEHCVLANVRICMAHLRGVTAASPVAPFMMTWPGVL